MASDSRKREKPVLSCTFCRRRKLRCDREAPCATCLQKRRAAQCTYLTPEQERKEAIDYRPHHGRAQARQRFARLENLVLEMRDRDMARNSAPASSERASPGLITEISRPVSPRASTLANEMGKLSITEEHTVYTGSSHWVTILEDIRRLKDELSVDGDDYSVSSSAPEPTLAEIGAMPVTQRPRRLNVLLSAAPSLTRDEILAMLPARKAVDRHVSHFFNAFDMAPFIIPREKFLAEYANFWTNPSAAPIMWVGLLFSVLSMSAALQHQNFEIAGLDPAETQAGLETYQTGTIHCLVAGDYLQQSRYTMETLFLHFAVHHTYIVEAPISNWILLGVVARIAMRMGLHRDPSHWPNIRPMQAEIWRRLWIILYQLDFFTSTQFGVPRIIKDSQCDTRPPAHYLENDLGPEHDILPPERPRDLESPLNFIIQRHAIIKVGAEIYDVTESGPPSPATIAALDAKIQNVVATMPEWLRYKSLEESIAKSPATILHQMFMDNLINKAIYLLHRRSFVKGSCVEDSARSNEICIKAALAILAHMRRMTEETQPGGLMYSIRWKVSYSLNHEFLQATMMLCFALSRPSDGDAAKTAYRETLFRRDDIVEALKHARSHWESIASEYADARKAVQAVTAVLDDQSHTSSAQVPAPDANAGYFDPAFEPVDPNYFSGFDFGQDMYLNAVDPSFFAADQDPATFGSLLDQFVPEQNPT